MTVANNYAPVVTAANGSTTVFSGSWNAISAANLVVQLLNTTTGVYTTVTQGVGSTQYQVTTLTATGFTITFNTAPATGNNVVISRLTPAAQPVPYTTSRGFQGSVEENSFDALTAMIQENNYGNTKAISAPVGDVATNLILPIASIRAGYVLAFDGSGNVIVSTQTLAQIQSPGTYASAAAASATASAASATASAASATASAGSATAAAASAAAAAASAAPWAIATGTGDAIVCSFSPAVTTLTDGLLVSARVPGANTLTNPTLKANATTANTITQAGGAALVAGNIPGTLAEQFFRYNLANTRWELMNPTPVIPTPAVPTLRRSVLTSSGNFASPAATTSSTVFKFTVTGGGGGGGPGFGGNGGAAGGTAIYFASGLAASTDYAVTIGAGGAGATSGTGGTGGASTVVIGATTITANGGGGGDNTTGGPAGGTATNGTINIQGGDGGTGSTSASPDSGGNGGGSFWGTGGAGGVGNSGSVRAGQPGKAYGSGGGGGGDTASVTGGAGANGICVVEWVL